MKLDMAKLKKMKMPESKKAAPEMEMDDGEEMAGEEGMDLELPELGEEEAPEHEAAESPEEEVSEHEALDLSALSDEELMAELKKRGIMGKMGKA
tara:strand:- start:280 stop:564 length:285 start_codon:yes stop_codon:yes gene_type:complete